MTDIAVVTGASSGIGLHSARALADAGWQVVATARHPDRSPELVALADEHALVDTAVLDVTDDASVAAAIGAVQQRHGRVDLLVNNAGVGHRGTLEQLSLDDIAAVMDVNFYGVLRATKAVLPSMRSAGSGRIITVTSMNGVVARPFSDAYNASKFAVEGLMEGLAPVASGFGVHVSVLEPGPVRTPFFANMKGDTGVGTAAGADDPYAPMRDAYNAMIGAAADAGERPEDVAAVIVAIAAAERPSLRYQSSTHASDMAKGKIVDVTGDTITAVTRSLIGLS
jgi:NAD(P)-dependent dehydrogenase (short-subunit alcohol dehydrogenase family)